MHAIVHAGWSAWSHCALRAPLLLHKRDGGGLAPRATFGLSSDGRTKKRMDVNISPCGIPHVQQQKMQSPKEYCSASL